MNKKYIYYFLRRGGVCTRLDSFDRDSLEAYLKDGFEIIGVTLDGTREVVAVEDVQDHDVPTQGEERIATVQYTDQKVAEVIQIIEKIVEIIAPTIDFDKQTEIKTYINALKQEEAKK